MRRVGSMASEGLRQYNISTRDVSAIQRSELEYESRCWSMTDESWSMGTVGGRLLAMFIGSGGS